MDRIKKIVVTGPESSGKSWLCNNLASYFRAPCAPEYARIFLEQNGISYDFDTLEIIIRGHLTHQQKHLGQARNLIFLDTDLINFKVWEKVVFGKTHDFLEEAIAKEVDHSYLLTYPDLPWEADPLRQNPENREEIFELHKAEIERLERPYQIVKGKGADRLRCAISATKELKREH